MTKKSAVSVAEEPEIQYRTNADGLKSIRDWLLNRGGYESKSVNEHNYYYDTRNNRLLREGVECRVKPKTRHYSHELKTPFNTHSQDVVPDPDGVLWRLEIKGKGKRPVPSLHMFQDVDVLKPVAERVPELWRKALHPKFAMCFNKNKIERTIRMPDGAQGCIEYALQTGHFATPDGQHTSDTWHIIELELKSGDIEALHAARRELEADFEEKLAFLSERKLIQGFRSVADRMTGKEHRKFQAFMS